MSQSGNSPVIASRYILLYHYRVALASARETKGWYFRGHRFMPPETLEQRLALVDEAIALIVTEITHQRRFNSRRLADSMNR